MQGARGNEPLSSRGGRRSIPARHGRPKRTLPKPNSPPHFALQLRGRIARLIAPLPAGNPIRVYGVEQMALLELLAVRDEFRGEPPRPDLPPLPSLLL